MTAADRHRQRAARLLVAIPHATDRVALVAAALAEAERAALAPLLRIADEWERATERQGDDGYIYARHAAAIRAAVAAAEADR